MARPRQVPPGGVTSSNAAASSAALTDYQTATPTNGQNVVMNDNALDGLLHLTPAGTLATLTITVPSNANSRNGQERIISTTQDLTAITFSGGTLLNPPAGMLGNSGITIVRVANNTWMRIV